MISRRMLTPVHKLQRLLRRQLANTASPHRDDYRFQVTRLFARDLATEISETSFTDPFKQHVEEVLDAIERGRISVGGVRVRVVGGPWPYMAEIVRHARPPRPHYSLDWLR